MKQRLGVAQALINAPAPAAARRADQRARPHRPPRSARHDRRAARPHHGVLLHAHPRRRRARLRHGRGDRRAAGSSRRPASTSCAARTAAASTASCIEVDDPQRLRRRSPARRGCARSRRARTASSCVEPSTTSRRRSASCPRWSPGSGSRCAASRADELEPRGRLRRSGGRRSGLMSGFGAFLAQGAARDRHTWRLWVLPGVHPLLGAVVAADHLSHADAARTGSAGMPSRASRSPSPTRPPWRPTSSTWAISASSCCSPS